jgi:hypothetical protein
MPPHNKQIHSKLDVREHRSPKAEKIFYRTEQNDASPKQSRLPNQTKKKGSNPVLDGSQSTMVRGERGRRERLRDKGRRRSCGRWIPGSGSGRVRRGGRATSSLQSWGRNGGGLWPRWVRREPITEEYAR